MLGRVQWPKVNPEEGVEENRPAWGPTLPGTFVTRPCKGSSRIAGTRVHRQLGAPIRILPGCCGDCCCAIRGPRRSRAVVDWSLFGEPRVWIGRSVHLQTGWTAAWKQRAVSMRLAVVDAPLGASLVARRRASCTLTMMQQADAFLTRHRE